MKCVPEDSGVYMCKAINKVGEAVSSCTTRVIGELLVVWRIYVRAAPPLCWDGNKIF